MHVDVLQTRGYSVSGVDYSADQLRVAVTRLPVVRGDARRLPFGSATVDLVVSMLTHTDIEEFDRLVAEAVRMLVPGGSLVYVGVTRALSTRLRSAAPNQCTCTRATGRRAGGSPRRSRATPSGVGSGCTTCRWPSC